MKINRAWYIFLLLTPFALCGALVKGYPSDPAYMSPLLIGVYVPTLTILRMKSMGMSWKQIFKIPLGFFNFKERFRIFTDK
jgi:hypothetical protein